MGLLEVHRWVDTSMVTSTKHSTPSAFNTIKPSCATDSRSMTGVRTDCATRIESISRAHRRRQSLRFLRARGKCLPACPRSKWRGDARTAAPHPNCSRLWMHRYFHVEPDFVSALVAEGINDEVEDLPFPNADAHEVKALGGSIGKFRR